MVDLLVKDNIQQLLVLVHPQDQEHVPAPFVAGARRRARALPKILDSTLPAFLPPLYAAKNRSNRRERDVVSEQQDTIQKWRAGD